MSDEDSCSLNTKNKEATEKSTLPSTVKKDLPIEPSQERDLEKEKRDKCHEQYKARKEREIQGMMRFMEYNNKRMDEQLEELSEENRKMHMEMMDFERECFQDSIEEATEKSTLSSTIKKDISKEKKEKLEKEKRDKLHEKHEVNKERGMQEMMRVMENNKKRMEEKLKELSEEHHKIRKLIRDSIEELNSKRNDEKQVIEEEEEKRASKETELRRAKLEKELAELIIEKRETREYLIATEEAKEESTREGNPEAVLDSTVLQELKKSVYDVSILQQVQKELFDAILMCCKEQFRVAVSKLPDKQDFEEYGALLNYYLKIEAGVLSCKEKHFGKVLGNYSKPKEIPEVEDNLSRLPIDADRINFKLIEDHFENMSWDINSSRENAKLLGFSLFAFQIKTEYKILSGQDESSLAENVKDTNDWIDFIISLLITEKKEDQDMDIAMERIARAHSSMPEVQKFLDDRNGTILNEREQGIQTLYGEVQILLTKFDMQRGKVDNNNHNLEIRLANQIILKHAHMVELMDSIRVIDCKDFNKIFRFFLKKIMELRDVIKDILKSFNGCNDNSTFAANSRKWAVIAGSVLPFLAEGFMKIGATRGNVSYIDNIQKFLDRVIALYSPEWSRDFLNAVGGGTFEEIKAFKENIEDYQLGLGNLMQDIGDLFQFGLEDQRADDEPGCSTLS